VLAFVVAGFRFVGIGGSWLRGCTLQQ
jgi:hypothetical protein